MGQLRCRRGLPATHMASTVSRNRRPVARTASSLESPASSNAANASALSTLATTLASSRETRRENEDVIARGRGGARGPKRSGREGRGHDSGQLHTIQRRCASFSANAAAALAIATHSHDAVQTPWSYHTTSKTPCTHLRPQVRVVASSVTASENVAETAQQTVFWQRLQQCKTPPRQPTLHLHRRW